MVLIIRYGIIDLAWRSDKEVWAVGGGGTMYVSQDAGKTFKFDNSADDIPGNLYQVSCSHNFRHLCFKP